MNDYDYITDNTSLPLTERIEQVIIAMKTNGLSIKAMADHLALVIEAHPMFKQDIINIATSVNPLLSRYLTSVSL